MTVDNPQQPVRSLDGIRLIEFHVEKLFDEFTYSIPLNLDSRVTAIIAPNGTGKTLCLRLINSLFEQKWGIFTDTKFVRASYRFSNGIFIQIDKSTPESQQDEVSPASAFVLKIYTDDIGKPTEWSPRLFDSKRALQVERYLPFLTRIGSAKWRHDHSGETYSLPEIMETFADSLPNHIRDSAYGKKPEILNDILQQINCRLIETQRLLILPDDLDEPYYRPTRRPQSTLAISRKALALKEIISREINAYATLSQSLDRSFPRRVISQPTIFAQENLRTQLADLDVKRDELMDAGILDTEADEPVALPEGTLEPAIARVLSVYAEDTKKKLASLSNILAKIKLFKQLIDQRFVTKDVRISRENGIDVFFKEKKIPLGSMSSGEQHQIVLFFELLFEIKKNSLILIDEPELSLHVAWQKKFIADLIKIIDVNEFDVILATHSPQLIGRWNELVVELGDVDDGSYAQNYRETYNR